MPPTEALVVQWHAKDDQSLCGRHRLSRPQLRQSSRGPLPHARGGDSDDFVQARPDARAPLPLESRSATCSAVTSLSPSQAISSRYIFSKHTADPLSCGEIPLARPPSTVVNGYARILS